MSKIKLDKIQDYKEIENIQKQWSQLSSEVNDDQVFNSFHWYQAWLKAFSTNKNIHLLKLSSDQQCIGIIPLVFSVVKRRPWFSMHHIYSEDLNFLIGNRKSANFLALRQLSIPANFQSGSIRGSWLCKPEYETILLNELAKYLRTNQEWDILIFPGLEQNKSNKLSSILKKHGLFIQCKDIENPLFGFSIRPWEEFFKNKSKHFRNRYRAVENKIKRFGALETISRSDQLETLAEEMFILAEKSWKQHPKKGQSWFIPLTEEFKNFIRLIVRQPDAENFCVFHQVKINGRLAFTMFSMKTESKMFALFMYFEPDFAKLSPGRVVFKQIFQWAEENNINWVDMNGNSPAVRLFADEPVYFKQVWIFKPQGYSFLIYFICSVLDHLVEWAKYASKLITKITHSSKNQA